MRRSQALALGLLAGLGPILGLVTTSEPADAAAGALVELGAASVVEGHTGTRSVRLPVTLDGPLTTTVTVGYSIVGGTATAGASGDAATSADFKAASGTLTFKAGVVSKFVGVSVYGDSRAEGDETITVQLTSVTGATAAATSATVTVVDDEADPGTVVSVGDIGVAEGDAKVRSATFPITLSRPAPGTAVSYRVVAGTATGGWSGGGIVPVGADVGDRSGNLKTVVFSTSAVHKQVKVNVAADLLPEGDETFTVLVESVTGAATIGRSGTGTILDTDPEWVGDPAFGPSPTPVGTVDPGSTFVGCDQATTRIVVTTSIHLDPACTYQRGLEIHTSNVTVDCRGAHLVRNPIYNNRTGIAIEAPTTTALHDITVRNCTVEDFDNNLSLQRSGFKTLAVGAEYDNAFADITIEHNTFLDSVNSGVFVGGFVTDVSFTDNRVSGAGSVGLYLEAGSKDNVVARNLIEDNGWRDVINGPSEFVLGTITIQYLSTGREGIAVDGSRNNLIHDNLVTGNAAGGIFVYKNCGENASEPGHWVRNYGSENNVLRHNTITDEPHGIWVGSRAAENQYFMDCSDTPILSNGAGLQSIFLDPASHNTVEYNRFDGVTNAIRVEADDITVRGNYVVGGERGVLIGTKHRTEVLGQPVTNITITQNTTVGTTTPYSWVWGKGTTTVTANAGNGAAGALVAGTQPTINPFLFVLGFV